MSGEKMSEQQAGAGHITPVSNQQLDANLADQAALSEEENDLSKKITKIDAKQKLFIPLKSISEAFKMVDSLVIS